MLGFLAGEGRQAEFENLSMLRFIKRLLNGVEENNKFLQLVKRSDGRI
jgi:heme oxygenase